MVGLQVDGDPVRFEHRVERVDQLRPDALLDGETPRAEAHKADQLGDADDPLVGDVADIGVTVKGERVVFAEGLELDRSLDDLAQAAVRSAPTLGLEHRLQLRVTVVAGGGV